MRLASIHTSDGLRLHVRGAGGYVDVASTTGDHRLHSLAGLLAAEPGTLDQLRALQAYPGKAYDRSALGPAVPAPRRIFCLGRNYREHALEGGDDVPSWPEVFMRGADSLLGPYDDLVKPAFTGGFDFEGELGVLIGGTGRYVPAGDVMSIIAGYIVLNDASARDWQRAGLQWTAGKNFDGSMPIGPELVTTDEADVSDAQLITTLNGQVMQSARTSEMLVGVAEAIEFLSAFTTLRPGDLIATGTPGGVGFARKPPVWLQPGDVIEVAIDNVGALRNQVVAELNAPTDWHWRADRPKSPVS